MMQGSGAVMLLAAVSAAMGLPAVHEDALRWREHMGVVRDFSCGLPQLQAVPLAALGALPRNNEALMPPVGVVRRCSSLVHCCGRGKVWGPAEQEVEQLVFQVRDTVDNTKPRWYRRVNAVSHTRCHCVYDDTTNHPR